MTCNPSAELVVKRYRRRVRSRTLILLLGAAWVLLLCLLDVLSDRGDLAIHLARLGITSGLINITLGLGFLALFVLTIYSNSCPICVTSFFRSEKGGGTRFNEISGYCDSCGKRFDISRYVKE